MAKIPQGAAVSVGRHPIPAGASIQVEAQPEADSLDILKPEASVGATGRGIIQGASLGFGDEAMGAADTVTEAGKRARQGLGLEAPDVGDADPSSNPNSAPMKKSWGASPPQTIKPIVPELPPIEPSLADVYRKARDSYRADNQKSADAHSRLYGAGKFAGGLAVPIPGGAGVGLAGKVAVGAAKGLGYGAASGVGESNAEDIGGMAKDAAKSGALGAAGGAAGGALAAGASRLASRFGAGAAAARTAAAADDLEKAIATAKGELGHSVQDSNRALLNLKEALKDPNVDDIIKRDIEAFLGSAKGRELVNQVAQNTLDAAPEKLGNMAAKQAAYRNAPMEAAAKSAADDAKSTLQSDVVPRAWHYLRPALAAGVGGFVGGPLGAAAGGVLGAAAGKPGRAIANLMKSPRFQSHSMDALESLFEGTAPMATKTGIVGAESLADGEDEGATLKSRFSGKKKR